MKCIIADDEFPSREELKYFIKEFSNLEIVKEFDNGIDVLKYIESYEIDVAFLDISMPGLDGISLAKIAHKMNSEIKIIFITAYKEYAVDAFEIQAFDYFLKPYSEERILSSLQRIEESLKENLKSEVTVDKITVLDNEKMYVINTEEIYYIEANGKQIKVVTKKGEFLSKNKISEITTKLNADGFYKCHRSYIVNLDKVKEVMPWFNGTFMLRLKDINKEVPVSRGNIKEFRKLLSM